MTPGISHNSSHIAIHTFGIDATTHSGAAVAVRNVRNNCKQRCLVDKPLWQNCSNLGSTMFDTSIGSSRSGCLFQEEACSTPDGNPTHKACLPASIILGMLFANTSKVAHWSRRRPPLVSHCSLVTSISNKCAAKRLSGGALCSLVQSKWGHQPDGPIQSNSSNQKPSPSRECES